MRPVLWVSTVLAVTAGCHKAKTPPLETATLDQWRATYRTYDSADICDAEPRWLFDELTSVNGLLNGFLEKTERPESGRYSEAQLQLFEEAPEVLPAVLEDHATNLSRIDRCGFAKQRGFPHVIKKGKERIAVARERLKEGPQIVATQRAQQALEQWRRERPRQELSAKLACPQRYPVGKAPLYFAWEDEDGRRQWLFCDGARVVGRTPDAASFEEPKGLSKRQRRRIKADNYLDAARSFPEERISRPPPQPDQLRAQNG